MIKKRKEKWMEEVRKIFVSEAATIDGGWRMEKAGPVMAGLETPRLSYPGQPYDLQQINMVRGA